MDAHKKNSKKEEELKSAFTEQAAPETENNEEAPQPEEGTQQLLTEDEALEQQLEKAHTEVEEMQDKYLRLSAEFDNYRKRTMKEKAELILNGGEKAFTSILPVVDDMERALTTMEKVTDVEAVKEGVELIYQKFLSILAQNGVKRIDTKDQPLNTDFHEAVAIVAAPTPEQKGKILDTVQTGYTLNDKVIRHAKVVMGE